MFREDNYGPADFDNIKAAINDANDGRVYMPIRAIPETGERGLEVFTKGGSVKISSLKVHELKSIWN